MEFYATEEVEVERLSGLIFKRKLSTEWMAKYELVCNVKISRYKNKEHVIQAGWGGFNCVTVLCTYAGNTKTEKNTLRSRKYTHFPANKAWFHALHYALRSCWYLRPYSVDVGCLINEELELWKEAASCHEVESPNLPEETERSHKISCQDIRQHRWDSGRGPPDYRARGTSTPWRSVLSRFRATRHVTWTLMT